MIPRAFSSFIPRRFYSSDSTDDLYAERYQGRIKHPGTAFFLCDVQEKFRPHIHGFDQLIENTKIAINGLQALDIPILVTEHVKEKLGSTCSELVQELNSSTKFFDKSQFSMVTDQVFQFIEEKEIDSVILAGIEAHVCVQQTALDLSSMGTQVFLLQDAISSRFEIDRNVALKRFQREDLMWVTTTESALFEIMGNANHPGFKNSTLFVKNRKKSPDLC